MDRSIVLCAALVGFTLGAACTSDDKDEAQGGAPIPSGTPSDPRLEGGAGHAPRPRYGGAVATTSRGHLELVVTHDGAIHLHLYDKAGAMRPTIGAVATVKAGSGADVRLEPSEGHLVGMSAPSKAQQAEVQVTVASGGKTEAASFTLDVAAPDGPKTLGTAGHGRRVLKGGGAARDGTPEGGKQNHGAEPRR